MSQLLTHQQEHKRKRRNKFLLKLGVVLFLLVAIFVGLVFVSRMSRFRIGTVELSGQTLVSPDEVVAASSDFLSGYYLGLFPRNNFLIFPNAALKNFLKEKFQRIDTIQTHLSGFKKLEITITERKQQALWCNGAPTETATATIVSGTSPTGLLPTDSSPSGTPETDTEKCYFLDDNGVIFSEAPTFSGDAYFKYYGGIGTGTSPAGLLPTGSTPSGSPIGQTYLATTTVFQDVSNFVQSVSQTSLMPVSVLAGSDGGFTMNLSDGGKIYFNLSQPLSKSSDNLKALLQNLQISSTSLGSSVPTGYAPSGSTSISNIDYIDLRFGDKLYYKMK